MTKRITLLVNNALYGASPIIMFGKKLYPGNYIDVDENNNAIDVNIQNLADRSVISIEDPGSANSHVSVGSGVTTNGNGPAVPNIRAGSYLFSANGTFGGATAKLQYTLDGTNWNDAGASVTNTTPASVSLPKCSVRYVTSGGTSANLNINLDGVG